jgi:hypothetical protein
MTDAMLVKLYHIDRETRWTLLKQAGTFFPSIGGR